MGAITSFPGAACQEFHTDVIYDQESSRVFTTFLALQDISSEMGPTLCFVGSHKDAQKICATR